MIRTVAFASLFALALAGGTAHAHQPVGGGSATISGGGRATHSQSGRLARIAGSNDGLQVEYLTSAPANPGPAARLVGGGDNAEVVYDRRR